MADRKLTFTVEIDTANAQASAARLREIMERALADIKIGGMDAARGGTSAAGGGMSGELRQAQQQAEATAKTMATIKNIDLTASTDVLIQRLKEAEQQARRTAGEIDKLMTVGTLGGSQRAYQDAISRSQQFGNATGTANIIASGYAPIGMRNAQFAGDDTSDWAKQGASEVEMRYRKRYSSQEQAQQVEALAAEQAQAEAVVAQVRRETAQRQIAAAQALAASIESGATQYDQEAADILTASNAVEASMADLMQEEKDALSSLANANKRITDRTNAADRAAVVGQGGIYAGPESAAGTTYGRQVALSVTKESVTNAGQLTAAMEKTVAATKELITLTGELGDMESKRARAAAAPDLEAKQLDGIRRKMELDAQETANHALNERKQTQVTLAEANIRLASTRAVATVASEAAKATAAEVIEQEKRKTAIIKGELAQQAAAQRQAATAQRASYATQAGNMAGNAVNSLGRNLMYGVAGAVGLYSIDQVGRQAYDAGRAGAEQIRTAQIFQEQAKRIGVSAGAMSAAIKSASVGSVSDMEAMQIGLQVLAQKWAVNSKDIVGDTEKLMTYSRRLAQVYTDSEGNVMSTMDVMNRLLSFFREGNKELVDQLGLSASVIADFLGISVDGLASATGAWDRARGVIGISVQEMERLGTTAAGVAEQQEQAAKRTANAWDRVRQGLAKPIAVVMETAAAVVEGAVYGVPRNAQLDTIKIARAQQQQNAIAAQSLGIDSGAATEQIRRLDIMAVATKGVAEALQAGRQGSDEMAVTMDTLATEVSLTNVVTDTAIQKLYGIVAALNAGEAAANGFAGGIGSANMAVQNFDPSAAVNAVVAARTKLQEQQYSSAVLKQATWDQWWNLDQTAKAADQDRTSGILGKVATQQESAQSLRDERRRADEAAASKASSAFESAAKKAADAFERAAQTAADAFKSKAEKVPGLLGKSSVTEGDMAKAAAGMPVNYADDWLRQLGDVVDNGKQYANVSVEDAAKRIGWTGGTESNDQRKAIRALADEKWISGELFAGGRNLDLINMGAVRASMNQQDQAASGQRSILAMLGLDPGTPLDAAAQKAFAKSIGIPEGMITGTAAAGLAPGMQASAAGATSEAALSETVVKGMEQDLTGQAYSDRLYALGEGLANNIHSGFTKAVDNLEWGSVLLDNLADLVSPLVFQQLSDSLPPAGG